MKLPRLKLGRRTPRPRPEIEADGRVTARIGAVALLLGALGWRLARSGPG